MTMSACGFSVDVRPASDLDVFLPRSHSSTLLTTFLSVPHPFFLYDTSTLSHISPSIPK
jgi:hypothetical protein